MSQKKACIVESPTKARTLSSFLKDFEVYSCQGHIRDLPEKEMGVDIEKEFKPTYVIPPSKRKIVQNLKKALQGKKEVYLATDPDREGEAIAWHLSQALHLPLPQRVVFHEITKRAVEEALKHPREINENLVEAQQARRVLDRLVGFSLSPLLWRKVKGAGRTLSAGRVQSVALRFIVEREREIEQFQPQEYWTIHAYFEKEGIKWESKLWKKGDQEIEIATEEEAEAIVKECSQYPFVVSSWKRALRKRQPPFPFRTSTLQQEANKHYGFSATKTMALAQKLYEGIEIEGVATGLITYMRTDSVEVSEEAKARGRDFICQNFGEAYLGESRKKKEKVKGAQEAHEAIRPTDLALSPEKVKPYLSLDEFRLYDIIFRRFIAALMKAAEEEQISIELACGPYLFRASGSKELFAGFRRMMPEERKDQLIPSCQEGEKLLPEKLDKKQHFTQPPPRYTEAGLVKLLEEKGIGRPSTYAPTIEVLKKRSYVRIEKKALVPTELGKAVSHFLVRHFPEVVDTHFTAKMEADLDKIEEGEEKRLAVLTRFYEAFQEKLKAQALQKASVKVGPEKTDLLCEQCQQPMVVRVGRYGKFLACSNFPACKNKKPYGFTGVPCPEAECEGELIRRRGKRGFFYGCSRFPDCKYTTRYLPKKKNAAS